MVKTLVTLIALAFLTVFVFAAVDFAQNKVYSSTQTITPTGNAIADAPQEVRDQINTILSRSYEVPAIYSLAFPLQIKVILEDTEFYLEATSTRINEIEPTEDYDVEIKTDSETLNYILENMSLTAVKEKKSKIKYESNSLKGRLGISIANQVLE